eukprot:m.1637729 g.1637729  ORF g.1637729 m.1637729 type:complete len:53 (-) comp26119_c0_seq1:1499-1657(-)
MHDVYSVYIVAVNPYVVVRAGQHQPQPFTLGGCVMKGTYDVVPDATKSLPGG